MKKIRKLLMFIVVTALCCFPLSVFAHPGRTDANGCHTCKTNCAKWGLYNGQYHCHNGGGSSSSSSSSSSSNYVIKSSNNSIKNVIIDGETLVFNNDNKANVNVTKSNVNVTVNLNDSKAKYEVKGNTELEIGDNEIVIDVTAENGSKRTYIISVYRKSNDTTLKSVKIDGEEVKVGDFMDFTTRKLFVKADIKTNDTKATYEIVGDEALKKGKNEYKVVVTAEDGSTKEYSITINKIDDNNVVDKGEEYDAGNSGFNSVYSVLGLSAVGGIGYGIYRLKKNR